jgi:hypothetical protein
MKIAYSISSSCLRILACLCVTLWLVGCATHRVDWAARVGHYNYDQAVTDLGPPDKHAKLADGTVVAEWLTDRGGTYIYSSPGSYGPYSLGSVNSYNTPNRYIRLTFDSQGQLTAWKKLYK